jgi:hypothetical protein
VVGVGVEVHVVGCGLWVVSCKLLVVNCKLKIPKSKIPKIEQSNNPPSIQQNIRDRVVNFIGLKNS